MSVIQTTDGDGRLVGPVTNQNPFPVNIHNDVAVATRTVFCPLDPITVPGVGASAQGALDAVGVPFIIAVPRGGVIHGARWYDLADQASDIWVHIFKREFSMAADNAAWSPSDTDIVNEITVLKFTDDTDEINSRVFFLENQGIAYSAPEGKLYFGVSTPAASTPTYALGSSPRLQLTILSDDPSFQEY
jgi:hypothetical protein